MMKMNFHFAVAGLTQPGKILEMLRTILFFRIKECVLRWSTFRIRVTRRQCRVILTPARHSGVLLINAGVAPLWLVMVDKAEHDMNRLAGHRLTAAEQIIANPQMHVALSQQQVQGQGAQRHQYRSRYQYH